VVVPQVSRQQATDLFLSSQGSLTAKLRRKHTALARSELLYLPYYRFAIELSESTDREPVRVAVDGLAGEAVFFMSANLQLTPNADEHYCEFELSATEARGIAMEEYRRMLLEQGLRNKTKTTVRSISEAEPLHYPFWVAYFRKGDGYDFKVLDAVSGEVQGVRMRKVLLRALRQLEAR
jgi:hypothetical protein